MTHLTEQEAREAVIRAFEKCLLEDAEGASRDYCSEALAEYREAILREDPHRQALEDGLRWAFSNWFDYTTVEFNEDTDLPFRPPEHDCGYVHRPDTGYCRWCEDFWNYYLLVNEPRTAAKAVQSTAVSEPICGVFVLDDEHGTVMCGQPRYARVHGPDAFDDAHDFEEVRS